MFYWWPKASQTFVCVWGGVSKFYSSEYLPSGFGCQLTWSDLRNILAFPFQSPGLIQPLKICSREVRCPEITVIIMSTNKGKKIWQGRVRLIIRPLYGLQHIQSLFQKYIFKSLLYQPNYHTGLWNSFNKTGGCQCL